MSNKPSATTKVVAFRLPNEVYFVLERRAKKQNITVSAYLKKRVKYDTMRKHGRMGRERNDRK